MTVDAILDRVSSYSCPLVEITGGEPLIQAEAPRLIDCLIEQGYDVLLETNGSLDIEPINPCCVKIVDIKCPSSGEHSKNNLANLRRLGSNDQLKFVIGNEADYRFAKETLQQLDAAFPLRCVLFSPIYGKLRPAKLAAWIQKDGLGVRLHLQLHKVIWPEIERGR